MGAVSANHEVEVDFDFASPLPMRPGPIPPHFKPGLVVPEVGTGELMIEKEGHVGHLLQNVEQALIESAAIDGED